jgi:hypothetical protein
MVNASEGAMRRRQAEPAYAGYLSTRQEAGPKGNGFSAWFATRSQAALDTGPGVKHRPKARKVDARNGVTHRRLSSTTGAENHPQAPRGGMAQGLS